MKLGAEPKKIILLCGLLLVAAYFLFFSGDDVPESQSRTTTAEPSSQAQRQVAARPSVRTGARLSERERAAQRGRQEFRPSLRPRRPEDQPDPMTMDPTLRLDLLAKLQEIEVQEVSRSLFEFGSPPAPKLPESKIEPAKLEEIQQRQREARERRAQAPKSKPTPPPPPIPLKYYGYINRVDTSVKQAFFLNGEDIFIAGEGDVINKGRYKIVEIGVNSAVVEDTEHSHKQTLRLEEARG